jgi:hypothetical protein
MRTQFLAMNGYLCYVQRRLCVCICECKLLEYQVLYHDQILLLDSQHCCFVFRRPVVQSLAQMLTVMTESLGDYWNNTFKFIFLNLD